MTQLPTIYKLTSTGKIQQWSIVIENDTYYTISGQVGGKNTTSKPTKCKAKNIGQANATTAEAQARKEAEAKRRLKLEGEYKETQAECTGDVGFVKPMLAEKWEDFKDEVIFPVYSDRKYNGMRCVITKNGMRSRKGKKIVSAPHIFEAVKYLFDLYPDLVLDGELYNHELRDDLGSLLSLVRQQKPTPDDLALSKKIVQYHIYDGYGFTFLQDDEKGKNFCTKVETATKFSIRKIGLKDLLTGLDPKKIFLVKSDLAKNLTELMALLQLYLSEGYEGQMVRWDEAYQNKRTKFLLKHKEWQDEEFEVIQIDEGEGNDTGLVGAIWLKLKNTTPEQIDGYELRKSQGYAQPDRFKSNLKGNNTYSEDVLVHKEDYIGKTATCKFHVYSPYGVPLYPYVIAFDREGAEGDVGEEESDD